MKYMGSKRLVAKELVPIIQSHIMETGCDTYVEPFVGGANVIDKITCAHKLGFDSNPYLIALLSHASEGGAVPRLTREEYHAIRTHPEDYPRWMVGVAGLCASFNAKWFGGYSGSYKKDGKLRDAVDEACRNLERQAPLLQDTNFACVDYRRLGFRNCVIYCDPPYADTTEYGYSKHFDTAEFWETMRRWSRENTVLISEHAAPDDFRCIWQQDVLRCINSRGKRKRVSEKLFMYDPS